MIDNIRKSIAGTVIVLVIMAVALSLGIWKQYQQWQSVVKEIQATENQIAFLEHRLAQLSLLQEQGILLDGYLAQLELTVPNNLAEQELMREIQSAAFKSGSYLLEINFDDPVSLEDYKELPVTLVLEGSFPNVLEFLHKLDTNPRLFRYDSLSLHKSREGIVQADLELVSFFRD